MKEREERSSGAADQQLLQHYRDHQDAEPSAALDARILAAAREPARSGRATPGPWMRLHGWLFGHRAPVRWSLALGGVAALGLGLSLTLKTLEQAPGKFDSPSPAAPAVQRSAAVAQKKVMAESARVGAQEAMADAAAAPAEAAASGFMSKAEAPELEPALREALREILRLREAGHGPEADKRLETLRQRHPQLDIEALMARQKALDEVAR